MSYWQMDDGFLSHHKTVRALRAGAEALHMWVALRTYVALNNSDGVIPDEDIDDLPGAPKNPRKWLKVLVECGKPVKGGARGAGLVDQFDGDWKLHNYERHGLSSDEIEKRKTEARERKRKWRERQGGGGQSGPATPSVPRDGTRDRTRDTTRDGTEDETRDGRPPIPSHPIPLREEDPPTPSDPVPAESPRPDPMGDQLRGRAPEQRDDVRQVHERWKQAVGWPQHKFRAPFDSGARAIATCIDADGLENAMIVADFCMNDGMVNGKLDEQRQKHTTLEYIFGKSGTFHRILAAAIAAGKGSAALPKRSASDAVAAAKALGGTP